MRIGAIIKIAGAHDARNAASRLTMPPSDGSCRARIQAALGRGGRQLTPALLGVG
jgi:hypothetical protein